jgi:uncharacterized phosphosugar-binding protein
MNPTEQTVDLGFPYLLYRIKENVLNQENLLKKVARVYADALADGGLVHVYANGHSRLSVEEMVIRMGALTGFHPILSDALTTFTDVVGANGIRPNQYIEKSEGIGAKLLDEYDFGPRDVLVVITATGTTVAAVDTAVEFTDRYSQLPIVGISSQKQSNNADPKHSSGKNLHHVIQEADNGYFIDNGMPMGDVSIEVKGQTGTYNVCPLSSVGALTVVQSLNELTIKELDGRGVHHHVLQNMHLHDTQDTYEQWIRDQRKRYSLAINNPNRVEPNISDGD